MKVRRDGSLSMEFRRRSRGPAAHCRGRCGGGAGRSMTPLMKSETNNSAEAVRGEHPVMPALSWRSGPGGEDVDQGRTTAPNHLQGFPDGLVEVVHC